jgi:hypothetical protein
MVYLEAYNPRHRHLTGLGVHYPRHRYLTGIVNRRARPAQISGLGAHYPRHRYLTGCGCGCANSCGCGSGTSITRMIGPLGDDIAPPNIGPDTSAPANPTLFASTGGSISDAMIVPPSGTTYGPATPTSMINTLPVNAPTPVAGAMGPAPIAPAISYGSPQAAAQIYASALAPQTYAAQSAASPPGTIMGIPTQYFMYGGLGLLALTVLGSAKGGRRR